jgi:hypothetical protein
MTYSPGLTNPHIVPFNRVEGAGAGFTAVLAVDLRDALTGRKVTVRSEARSAPRDPGPVGRRDDAAGVPRVQRGRAAIWVKKA